MQKLRKIVGVILIMILFTSTLNVNAAENEVLLDDCSGIDAIGYEEANNEFVKLGEVAQQRRSGKTLYFKHYFQDGGESWCNDVMQTCNKTIAKAGCCLTSFAMIQRYFGGNDDPGQVNTKLGTAACPFDYSVAASRYGYSISGFKNEKVSDDYAKSFIIGAISADRPVLVGMHTDVGNGTHFVAAYGYSGNTVYIHDPASNRNYTTLDSYLNSYYVDRLVIFN